MEAEGPRIVVFRLSGTIDLKSTLRISNPYITIAGQTAPGDGIAIKRYPLSIDADEVILRYLKVRLGDETGEDADAVSSRYHKNITSIVSASWSVDEVLSIYHCEDVTVQWSPISQSLYDSAHVKGEHGYGGIWGATAARTTTTCSPTIPAATRDLPRAPVTPTIGTPSSTTGHSTERMAAKSSKSATRNSTLRPSDLTAAEKRLLKAALDAELARRAVRRRPRRK